MLIAAIYNGYPIIYHDLSTYVANGFDLNTPIDRPITYCLFVRVFSLNGFSLWPVVLMQAYITSFLLFKLVRTLFTSISNWVILAIILILSLFTGLSWTVSQIMPDIYTALSIIIIAILFLGELKPKEKFLFYFLFLLSTAMHLSHISFNIALLSVLLITDLVHRKQTVPVFSYKNILILFLITAMAFTTMLSASAKSKHVFFMGAMAEHGILQIFLEDNCEGGEYELCAYKDEIPKRAYQFVWDQQSPVYKMGSWQGAEDEFNEIIFKTLTTPKYIFLHIKASIYATLDQLVTFKINDSNGVFLEGTLPYDRMVRYLPNDLERYRDSKQMKDDLGFTVALNILFAIVIVISVVLIIFLLFRGDIFRGKPGVVLFLFVAGVIVNAWVSGTFANAINRLGCKVIWLIPFIAIIGLLQYIQLRNSKTDSA